MAFGLSQLGFGVIHASTDSIRTIKSAEKRPYNTYSAKTDEELKEVVDKFSKYPEIADQHLFLIIDGGANKHKLDESLSSISDLVLIPVKDSFDDYEAAVLDLQRLPRSFAIRTAWPYEYKRIPLAEAELATAFGELTGRLFNHTIKYSENIRLITNNAKLDDLRKAKYEANRLALAVNYYLDPVGVNDNEKQKIKRVPRKF